MNLRIIFVGMLVTISASASIAAVNLKPFESGSLDKIVQNHSGQPFILMLWSIDCPPCLKELDVLKKIHHQFPANSLVLISTDDQESAGLVHQTLNDFKLDQIDSWIFAESIPERLRYSIDPSWYGELPRSYFYDAANQRSAHSGSLNAEMLQQWLDKSRLNLHSAIQVK